MPDIDTAPAQQLVPGDRPAASPSRSRWSHWWPRLRPVSQAVPFTLVIAVVLGFPVILLVVYSFRKATFLSVLPGFTLSSYQAVFADGSYRAVILKSLAVGFGVAGLVTLLSFVMVYAMTFRMRRRPAALALAVVLISGVSSLLIRIYAWGTILGTNGLINRALEDAGLISRPLGFLFFGYFAIAVTMTYVYLPIGVLMTYSAMQHIDPRTVEASRDLGAGRWRTAVRAVAPQARTGLVSCFLLTAILACSDYVTPGLVGGVRGQMIGSVIHDVVLNEGDYPTAAALGIVFLGAFVLVLVVLVGAWLGLRPARRRLARLANRAGAAMKDRTPVRVARLSLSRLAALILLVYLVVPTLVVIVFSFNRAQTVGLPFTGFTTRWYPAVVRLAGFTAALSTSLRVAAGATVVAVIVAIPAAFALCGRRSRGRRTLWALVSLPFAIPGVMLGVSVLTAATDRGIQLGTAVTLLVHVVLFAPLIVIVVYVRLSTLDPRLGEAARDLGSRPVRVLRTITMPLLLPSIVGAALLAAAYSLDELVVTTFTIGTNATIPVWLYGQARRGFTPAINSLGVMLLCGTLLIFALALVIVRRSLVRPASDG